MSLPQFSSQAPLFSTAAMGSELFAETDRYRLFARHIYPLLARARGALAAAYCEDNGRPAAEPVLLMGVSLLQFLEGVPDREAVDLLRYHAGWNFALNRQLGQPLFHPTTLSYFRQRLISHELSPVAFKSILRGLLEAGLVERRSAQRLDSMQILGLVSRMSRLECVRGTLRLALQYLEENASTFGPPAFWDRHWERYVHSKLDFRLERPALEEKMNQTGEDGLELLEWVEKLSDPRLRQSPAIELLRRVWEENFQRTDQGQLAQTPHQPAGGVHNPHDPQAQWAAKGQGKNKKEHVGYKLQVAETVAPEVVRKGDPTPSFLTAVVTQPAIASDDAGFDAVQKELKAMGLKQPSQLYVDAAYITAKRLAHAQGQGRELIGPAQGSPSRGGRYSPEDFQICVEDRVATCPAEKTSTQCSRLTEEQTGKISYRFEWTGQCQDCALRDQCLGAGQEHRTVTVGEHHTVLQARRQEQKSEAFRRRCHKRNAIEGTQSELVRAHGARRARYRGLEKMRLQNYFVGAACNAKRWVRRMIWELKQARIGAKASLHPGLAQA
jgi:transposase